MHDGFWDKAGSAADATGDFLKDVGETALSDLASLGNAMVHDLPAVGEVLAGLALAELAIGGETGGAALDATGIGAILGVVSAAGIASGLALAGSGLSTIAHDAAGQYRVDMTSDGTGGGGGGQAGRLHTRHVAGKE